MATDNNSTLEFYNISVVDAPLVRDYYWNYLNIPELNRRLLQAAVDEETTRITSAVMKIPPMPVFSSPFQIIFHIQNHSTKNNISFKFKRIKHCECECIETPVTINKYKMMFHCPHRPMMKLTGSNEIIEPDSYGYIILRTSYNVPGKNIFEFEWEAFENQIISLIFEMDVLQFDPIKCVITGALLPVEIDDYDSYQQPLWLFNQYGTDLNLCFASEAKSLKIINPKVNLKKHSIHPLLVIFRPEKEGWCSLNMSMIYMNIRNDITIKAKGVKKIIDPIQYSPLTDTPCPQAPYTIFQNSVLLNSKISGEKVTTVVVSNHGDKCVECKWNTYVLPEYFKIKCTPDTFLCKPRHPVMCTVELTAYKKRCRFHHVPLALEIHRYKIPPINQDYEKLHSEKESIDDSKIFEPTLITKIFLNINIIIEKYEVLDFLQILKKCEKYRKASNFDRNKMDAFVWKNIQNDEFFNKIISHSNDEICTFEELIGDDVKEDNYSIDKN